MRKILYLLLTAGLLACIPGCGDGPASGSDRELSGIPDSAEVILEAVGQLSGVNSYALKTIYIQETIFKDNTNRYQSTTIAKTLNDPYTVWAKTDELSTSTSGEFNSRTVQEAYLTKKNGGLSFYVRYGSQKDPGIDKPPVFGEWEKAWEVKKEQVEQLIDYYKGFNKAELYILSSNINSFQPVKDDSAENKDLLEYKGSIDPVTVVEAYGKYLRESYLTMNFVAGKENPTPEELKKEITGGRSEFQIGPTKLAFSSEPVPVTLWIDPKTFDLKRVTVDETAAMQAIMDLTVQNGDSVDGNPAVIKASTTFEFISINEFDKIPAPTSLKW